MAGALLTAGCDSDADRDDPEEVARAFWEATCEGDVETAHGLVGAQEGVPLPSEESFAVVLERRYPRMVGTDGQACRVAERSEFEPDGESAGTATVWLQAMDASGAVNVPVPMIERDGDWHVRLTAVLDLE